MKKRAHSGYLIVALLSLLSLPAASYAQEIELGTESESAQPSAVADNAQEIELGAASSAEDKWFWGLVDEPAIASGVTRVKADAQKSSTLYASGPGFIAVSWDSGGKWHEMFRFSATSIELDADEEEILDEEGGSVSTLTAEQKLVVLREYLRTELEREFDSDTVEFILEEIDDDELLAAETIRDIEVLRDVEIEMDESLSQVVAEAEYSSTLNLSEGESFINRYQALILGGAEVVTALERASNNKSVWDFVSAGNRTYAVTSDAIYFTEDLGKNWNTYFTAPSGSSILSFASSNDRNLLAIGMTDGMYLTRDGGGEWLELSDFIEGGVYDIQMDSQGRMWALTTEQAYYSQDAGLTWFDLDIPTGPNEYVVSVIPGHGESMLTLTNEGLYLTNDGRTWNDIGSDISQDEIIRQVVSTDPTLSSFVIRTDTRVFEHRRGRWTLQNQLLFASQTGDISPVNDGYSLFAMASPVGIWLAQKSAEIEITDDYKKLFQIWESEPSDYEVILKALEAHYIDDFATSHYGMRSRLAWLLPTIKFDYDFNQRNLDKTTHTFKFEDKLSEGSATVSYDYRRERRTQWSLMANWNISLESGFKAEHSGDKSEMMLKGRRNNVINSVKKAINKRRASQTRMVIDIPKLPESKKGNVKKIVKVMLSLDEAEATLNYLTGGYYIPAVHKN